MSHDGAGAAFCAAVVEPVLHRRCVRFAECAFVAGRRPADDGCLEAAREFFVAAPAELHADGAVPYGFVPTFAGASRAAPVDSPEYAEIHFGGLCFPRITVGTRWINSINQNITITPRTPYAGLQKPCTEHVQLWSAGLGFKDYLIHADATNASQPGTPVYTSWAMSSHGHSFPPWQQWFVRERGLQVFYFKRQPLQMIGDLLATAALMLAFVEASVTGVVLDTNVDFMRRVVQHSAAMQPALAPRRGPAIPVGRQLRPFVDVLPGDGLIVLRLDGIDPTLAWTMGFTAAHVAFVLENATAHALGLPRQLAVCEANVKSAFWPKDGVQCASWDEWLSMAATAQLNVALAPLAAASTGAFNNTAAWNYVSSVVGLQYGFPTLLPSWLDTADSNYPCVPVAVPMGSRVQPLACESPALEEMKAILLDASLGDSTSNPYRQQLQQRLAASLGVPVAHVANLSVGEVLAAAGNLTFADLARIPENDAWRYRLKDVNGAAREAAPSLVCSVLACQAWRAGGVYGGTELQCAEQTPWDVFAAGIFDDARLRGGRPTPCREADPEAPLCQLLGNWTSASPQPAFNSRPIAAGMGDACPTQWPNYTRPTFC